MNSQYDKIADWYDSIVNQGTIIHDAAMEALLILVGDITGLRICDVGCGQGVVSRALALRGASVLGIDISDKLLAKARLREERRPLNVEYRLMNAEKMGGITDGTFDGAVCNMALTDICDLPAVCSSVYRILRTRSWFVFSLMHPCFQAPHSTWETSHGSPIRQIRDYFTEGLWYSANPSGMRARVGAYHRTLGTYFNVLAANGFAVETLFEPRLSRETDKSETAYDAVPPLLVARFRKNV